MIFVEHMDEVLKVALIPGEEVHVKEDIEEETTIHLPSIPMTETIRPLENIDGGRGQSYLLLDNNKYNC